MRIGYEDGSSTPGLVAGTGENVSTGDSSASSLVRTTADKLSQARRAPTYEPETGITPRG